MSTVDHNNLQQEERDWIGKAILENNGKIGPKKAPTTRNWKLRMSEKEFEEWRKNQNRFSLFFNGVSKNNPGKAGASGVISDPDGKEIITYEWGLGETTNNKEEAYSLLLGTRILKKHVI